MVTNSGKIVSGGSESSLKDSWALMAIDNFKNKDGSYSLYDNLRHAPNNIFHEQVLSFEVLKPSISLKDGKVVLGSVSATLMTGGWEIGSFDLSLLDIGKLKLAAGYTNGALDLTAMASVWAPSITVNLWDVNMTVSANIGSIGGKINVGPGIIDIGGAFGWGISISLKW